MTDNEQAFLDAAVGLYQPAVELLDYIDEYGTEPSGELRVALEKAIARFETWRATVIDEAWAKLPAEERSRHIAGPDGEP